MPFADAMTPEDFARLQAEAARTGRKLECLELPPWVAFYLERKDKLESFAPGACLPPIAVAWTGDQMLAAVSASKVDRDHGLYAVRLLHGGMDPDEVWVCFEVTRAQLAPGSTEEDFRRQYPPGSMQRLIEIGFNSEVSPLVECLEIFRLHRSGALDQAELPYVQRDGARAAPFGWLSDQFIYTDVTDHPEDAKRIYDGLVADALRAIAVEPFCADEPEAVSALQLMGWTRAKSVWHFGRAVLRMLRTQGFDVFDALTERHPEWHEDGMVPIHEEPEGFEPGLKGD